MSATPSSPTSTEPASHFLRQIIEADLAQNRFQTRRWAGTPGDAQHHQNAALDPARIRTRFPPEPNGYLHIGHAKSIFLNFGLARDYGGVCHLRLDDTNPEKEETEYVDAIVDTVQWLGFDWQAQGHSHLYHASDYFDFMYRAAEYLIEVGLAYVDEHSPEEIRAMRGDFSKPGQASQYRTRTPAENLTRFREMAQGKHPDGAMVLRAKIDMASPNINLRDPAIYRIRHATHHRTGDRWCIYPMYTYAHPIEDALENITHSICTLEFEDQRPFYDWLMEHLCAGGLLQRPAPHQYEFARLNLTYVVTSKRKLAQLVNEGHVNGWDDPRMPTLVGLRRRGYTPQALGLFCERIGVSKEYSWIEDNVLEGALRETLDPIAPRAIAVLDPIKLVITNWEAGAKEPCHAPRLPSQPEGEQRHFDFERELWIERSDYEDTPPKGYHRLYPGNLVRLKYGYVVRCLGATHDADGRVLEVQAELIPDTKSGTPGASAVKVKGVVTWLGVSQAQSAQVRWYERLFTVPQPDAGGQDFLSLLNPDSLKTLQAFVEPSLAQAAAGEHFQFERLGYFVTDLKDHGSQGLVFNRVTGLKDTWVR